MLFNILQLLTTACISAQALAPLEFTAANKIYFGPWYDRKHGDTPISLTNRVNYKNFSIFQSDMNISATLQSDFLVNFISQLEELKTDAIAYVTLYPMEGYSRVSDSALSTFAGILNDGISKGHRFFVRYASEMNGNWFPYGQQPEAFKQSWRRVIPYLRSATNNSQNVAFIWAPNSGNGYPFPGGPYMVKNFTQEYNDMDTNKDGFLDNNDDPYSPFYPGDDLVDWVGFSIYHYGAEWPWITNDAPAPGKFESILIGNGTYGPFNLYRMFSGDGQGGYPVSLSKGNKPFIITETGSTFHLSIDGVNGSAPIRPSVGPGRASVKQTWWRQFLNATFLQRYPKLKAICTFEFIKHEENTFRDFTNMGDTGTGINSQFGNDGGAMAGPVLQAFVSDLRNFDSLIVWSNYSSTIGIKAQNKTSIKENQNSAGGTVRTGWLLLFTLLLSLWMVL